MIYLMESGRRDLNPGPHGPEPCALAGLSHAPISNVPRDYNAPPSLSQGVVSLISGYLLL